ncbi:VWA domain-containing protein [Leptolyngbya sp. 7M]|uniref:VWA domain-containing protein n=1 Tax=Leptolyngbya sp. 7M TaxID=2812896 RepID=UPI001B8D78CF|nr:VWA domain-containing protein [Leptolyngbya sp. 7M]QYO63269.1 VWA domain-containing protein [Leptolyngbya sp. 7M]
MMTPKIKKLHFRISSIDSSIRSVWCRVISVPAPRIENLFLYENGFEQRIRNFTFDPSPSRIVLLVDNSKTIGADIERLKKATMEFAYEIYDGDQLFVVAYDETAEIIQEWTDDADKLSASLATFRKQNNPHLFDALEVTAREILVPLMPGNRKTAIVIIGDGLDRGSRTEFDKILAELQNHDITVYALQLPDRTGGAYRRNQPKAGAVINQLVEGTGGLAFPFEKAAEAAKAICDELRKNRYQLSYLPINTSSYDARTVFLVADRGIAVRTKKAQPPNIK